MHNGTRFQTGWGLRQDSQLLARLLQPKPTISQLFIRLLATLDPSDLAMTSPKAFLCDMTDQPNLTRMSLKSKIANVSPKTRLRSRFFILPFQISPSTIVYHHYCLTKSYHQLFLGVSFTPITLIQTVIDCLEDRHRRPTDSPRDRRLHRQRV